MLIVVVADLVPPVHGEGEKSREECFRCSKAQWRLPLSPELIFFYPVLGWALI